MNEPLNLVRQLRDFLAAPVGLLRKLPDDTLGGGAVDVSEVDGAASVDALLVELAAREAGDTATAQGAAQALATALATVATHGELQTLSDAVNLALSGKAALGHGHSSISNGGGSVSVGSDGNVGVGTASAAAKLHVLNSNPDQPCGIDQGAPGQTAPLSEWRNSSGAVGMKVVATPGFSGYTLTDDTGYSRLAFANGNNRGTLDKFNLVDCSLGNSGYPDPWLCGSGPNGVQNYIRMSRDAVDGGGDVNIFTQLYAAAPYPRLTMTGHGVGFYIHGIGGWPEHAKSGPLTAEIEPITGNWKFYKSVIFQGAASQTAPLIRLQQLTSTGVVRDAASIDAVWTDTTDATRTSQGQLGSVYQAGALTARIAWDAGAGADTTGVLLWDFNSSTRKRVEVGVADSAGTGYRTLRILN